MNKSINKQIGFTLIELMVAIVLGLLISAAAVQIFINSSFSTKLQQGVAETQDSGIFGLDMVLQYIQLANYGNPDNLAITDQTPRGGIVFTSGVANTTNVNIKSTVAGAKIEDAYLSQSAIGPSNASVASDQLTIQFVAPIDMFNCEGEKVFKNDLIVQRYFLRSYNASNQDDTNVASLGLACDANTPANTAAGVNRDPTTLTGFGTSSSTGEILIPRVDQMTIQLLTKAGNIYRYYTLNDYKTAVELSRVNKTALPEIVMVKMAVLTRSNDKNNSPYVNPSKTFKMLGENVTLKTASSGNNNKYAREVYEIAVSLRNGYKE
ncbi:PilW family protein [Acinetobacter sichuanensis]|uniref:PilW family protein n=1 Tax=Acinetobacter sichuanensis TaxID=2136183 RepID=UPI00280DB70E|nr:PilW family protein [Acinetobacter sichuanensis]MDQ9020632.1 PilW family protein [Acinetobacter sichuanensis]